jgi:hypothetical protein
VPLARWLSHLDPFIASLIEQQYRASVIYIKARHGLALDRWLPQLRVASADFGEAQIERCQDRYRHRRIRTATRQIERKAVTPRGRLTCYVAIASRRKRVTLGPKKPMTMKTITIAAAITPKAPGGP